MNYVKDIQSKRFAIYGWKQKWPRYLHGRGLKRHLRHRGAMIVDGYNPDLDYLVVGEGREKGKTAAVRKAAADGVEILNEFQIIELLRLDLTATRFSFTGGFTLGAAALDGGPEALLENVKAQHVPLTEKPDYLVVGDRRAKGKTADLRIAEELKEAGAEIELLPETNFLEMMAGHTVSSDTLDFKGLVTRLHKVFDTRRIDRAIKMLKKESYDLYADVDGDHLIGVVRSQSFADTVYASYVGADGRYGCHSHNLEQCMGLQGDVCKHIILLILGLVSAGKLDAQQALVWSQAAKGARPKMIKEGAAETLIRYKGAEAGEIDWRPAHTAPEDFYML